MRTQCSQYRRLLPLSREGELTQAQRDDVQRHLATCPACAAEMGAFTRMQADLSVVRGRGAVHPAPELLEQRIMARVRNEPQAGAERKARMADRVLDLIGAPAVRFAAAATLLIVVGSTVAHFLSIAADVERLSAWQVHQAGHRVPGPAVAYEVQIPALTASGAGELLPALPAAPGETIVMTGEQVRSALATYAASSPASGSMGSARGPAGPPPALTEHLQSRVRVVLSFTSKGV